MRLPEEDDCGCVAFDGSFRCRLIHDGLFQDNLFLGGWVWVGSSHDRLLHGGLPNVGLLEDKPPYMQARLVEPCDRTFYHWVTFHNVASLDGLVHEGVYRHVVFLSGSYITNVEKRKSYIDVESSVVRTRSHPTSSLNEFGHQP